MTKNTFHEQQFFNALRDIFVGAEIEGDSGFINLMQIKSRYYQQGVFPKLKKDIDQAVADFPEFREELFDKLYTFFQRYFSESGSIYFRYTPLHQNIYEKVYTDDRDVVLFWKTHMLYYVKTDRIFKSLKVEVDGINFYFDASSIEHKRANEKRDIVFSFREVAQDGTLVFDTAYSFHGKITKIEQILKDLKKEDVEVSDETLEKAFRVFEKQSEVDYFINKNARAFLEEQFDLWLYQYMFAEKNIWSTERIAQLQALKEIAYKVIGFISQFEDELVKIWNKPKFVRNSHYIITLDHFIKKDRENLLEEAFNHVGMTAQMKEWLDLGMIESDMDPKELLRQLTLKDLTGEHLHPEWLNLPLDTKHFPDMEIKLLSLFGDLDQDLDGWLIHSENYQALSTLKNKFFEKVKTIYIDPPFNLGKDPDYLYVVDFKDSSWITILENRLTIAKDYLKDSGNIFVRCDYNGNMYVRLLLNEIFKQDNFINEIIVNRGKQRLGGANKYSVATDSLYFYAKSQKLGFERFTRERYAGEAKSTNMLMRGERTPPERVFKDPDGNNVTLLPPKNQHWKFIQSKIDEMYDKGIMYLAQSRKGLESGITKIVGDKRIPVDYVPSYYFDEKKTIDSNWTDISGYSANWSFDTENSEDLLYRVISTGSPGEDDIVFDFFLGSGTTISVAHKNGNKWIGVEMGDHFFDVVLPRIKKVLFGEDSGISKDVEWTGGGFIKYFDLEQYEETLQKVRYRDADLFDDPNQDPYHAYVFLRDLKLLESIEIDADSNRVRFHPERLYPDIDLAETLSHLRGKWIKRITEDFVEFQDGEKMSLTDPDWETLKPMVWWA